MEKLKEVNQQATCNTKCHLLYGYYYLGLNKSYLVKLYKKDVTTVRRWIKAYESSGRIERKQREVVYLKFDEGHRNWIIQLYKGKPIL